jgi:hypothetical protein
MWDTMGKRRARRTLAFTSHEEKLMRNNWNFSHSVSARSNAFGSHDASTTSGSRNDAAAIARGKAMFIAKYSVIIDGETGKPFGEGGALALYESFMKAQGK